MKPLHPLAITLMIGLSFALPAFAGQPDARIPYRVVDQWVIPNGGFVRVIVIDPKYRHQKEMRSLGDTLKYDTRNDRIAMVAIYDNERASKMHHKPPSQNTKDGRFWDEHYIGIYTRNINTGFHELEIGLSSKGLDGVVIKVKY